MSTCRYCQRRRPDPELALVRRLGMGSYRRAPRWYRGYNCRECVEHLVCWFSVTGGTLDRSADPYRHDGRDLLQAVLVFINRGVSDLDEARWRKAYPYYATTPFDEFFPMLVVAVDEDRERDREAAVRARVVLREALDEIDAG